MRISTAQLAQMVAQTMQGAKEAGTLELKVGSVVRATLVDFLGDGEAMIAIGGNKVRAKLDVNLQLGERVNLLVTGQQQRGALELKVVASAPGENASAQPSPDPAAVLKALQVPDNEAGRALVREFLARGVPLKADTLQAATQALGQNAAGSSTQGKAAQPAQIQTLGKMAELGIPIYAGTFQAVHALETGPKLHELLTKIASTLAEALPESAEGTRPAVTAQADASSSSAPPASNAGGATPQGTASRAAMTTLSASASAVANGAEQDAAATPTTQTPAPAEATRGQETARQAGATAPTTAKEQPVHVQEHASAKPPATKPVDVELARHAAAQPAAADESFPENKISRSDATESARFSQTETGKTTGGLSETAREHLDKLSKVVHELLRDSDPITDLGEKAKKLGLGLEERIGQAVRKLGPDAHPAQIRAALEAAVHQAVDGDPTLKAALLQTQSSSAELSAAGLRGLTDDVSALLQQVTGQQVMQTAGTQRSDLLYQFAAVPVQVDGQERTVELHVMSRKGPGQKALDPANCYVLFCLDMPRLGPLDVHLHIVDRVVGIRFQTEAQDESAKVAATPNASTDGEDALLPLELSGDDQRELRERLQSVGFHLGIVKVEQKQEAGPNERLPLLPPIITQGAFDLKI
jgi:hypothetical protein